MIVATYPMESYSNLSQGLIPHHKGWWYQLQVQKTLDEIGAQYEGYSTDFFGFLKHGNNVEGYDFKLKLPNGTTEKIECKFRNPNMKYTLFQKSFEKEYLSKNCDVIVTNNIWALSFKQRRALELKGVLLLTTEQFRNYVLKLIHTLRRGTDNILRQIFYKTLQSAVRKVVQDSVLDRFIEIPATILHKTEKKESFPQCENCKKRNICDILYRVKACRSVRPNREVQTTIDRMATSIRDYDSRRKEWRVNFVKALREQHVCLQRRSYLQRNLKRDLFDVE